MISLHGWNFSPSRRECVPPGGAAGASALGLFLAAAALACWTAPARADLITLKSGDEARGLLEDISTAPEKVRLITVNGEIEIPRSKVSRVEKEPRSTGWRRIAEDHIKREEWERARQALDEAARQEPVDPRVETLREEIQRRVAEAGLSRIEQQKQETLRRLDTLEDLIERKQFEEARRVLESAQVALADNADAAARIRALGGALYVAWAFDAIDRTDPYTATKYFQEALRYDPQNRVANDKLLQYWADNPARRPDVIAGYRAKLDQNPDDLLAVQKLIDLYFAENQVAQALPLLERLDREERLDSLGYTKALFDALSRLSAEAFQKGDLAGARRYYEKLLARFPNADPTPITLFEYNERLSALQPDDFTGRAELAEFLRSRGLDTRARREVDDILAKDPTNAKALELLRGYANAEMAEMMEEFREGKFSLALADAQQLIETYGARFPDLAETAREWIARAEIEVRRQAFAKSEQANRLVALGDEYRAKAETHVQNMRSNELNRNVRVVNDRNEAIKFAQRAIRAYQSALRLDSSLGGIASGQDLNEKIRDMQRLISALTAPAAPLPALRHKL